MIAAVLVVFDTNVFRQDVRADRSQLRAIFDGAVARGVFDLCIPEVVLQELDKQFAQRSKKVVRDVNAALGRHARELHELGLEGPAEMKLDRADVRDYRAALERRIADVGGVVLPVPRDLTPAVSWAVKRRKPFKDSGDGLQDAAIWLSVLELAGGRDEEIVLVSSNTKDFGNGSTPPGLAPELCTDLEERGLARDKVRLVAGLHAFAEEAAERVAELERAAELRGRVEQLAADGAFAEAVEQAVMWSRIDQHALDLGVDLEEDPQVVAMDIEQLTITEVARLPGGTLMVEAVAEVQVQLHLLIYKADYYGVADGENAVFSIVDPDYNDHYVEAESELTTLIELTIWTDSEANDVQVEMGNAALAPAEMVGRAMRGRGRRELLHGVRAVLAGASVDGYTPEARIESSPDDAFVERVHRDEIPLTLRELVDTQGDIQVCEFDIRFQADVTWTVSAPTPFDAEQFASLAENVESGAPFLHALDYGAPLHGEVVAHWDEEHGWHGLEAVAVRLEAAEQARRNDRPSAAKEALDEPD